MSEATLAADLTTAQRWRGLVAVIASAGMVGIVYGALYPLVAIVQENQGQPNWAIGITGAAPAVAAIVMGMLIPKVFARIGFFNAMMLAVVCEAGLILLMLVSQDYLFWFLLRFATGLVGAIHWIGSEVWIISIAPKAQRGRAIALYMIALSAGFALGPVLIELLGPFTPYPFLACAGLILIGMGCIWMARGSVPTLAPAHKAAYLTSFKIAPLMMAAAFVAGFVDVGIVTHLVNYARDAGMEQDAALRLLTIVLLANLVMQLPIGWLAERVNKRNMLIFFGFCFFACPLVSSYAIPAHPYLMWPALLLWGVASMGIYTVALVILGERFSAGLLAAANGAIVSVYQFGSILGPAAGGMGMDAFGHTGLMYVFSTVAAGFLIFAAYRTYIRWKHGVTDPAQPLVDV